MTAKVIRQKLFGYTKAAEEKKIKAIYTMLEEEIQSTYAWHDSEALIAELDARSSEYKSGRVRAVAWEDDKSQITKCNGRY